MALDTVNKRRAILTLLPVADGVSNAPDRRHFLTWFRIESVFDSFFFWREHGHGATEMTQDGDASNPFVSQKGSGGSWVPTKDFPEEL